MVLEQFNGPYRYTEAPEAIDLCGFARDEIIVGMLDGKKIAMHMHCPCGCNRVIRMSLEGQAQRSIEKTSEGYANYHPSINRTAQGGCKSHFFINYGMVRWCE